MNYVHFYTWNAVDVVVFCAFYEELTILRDGETIVSLAPKGDYDNLPE